MTQKSVLGLIGGIGSGKSRVADALARRGGRVIAGDLLGHEALRQPQVRDQVVARTAVGLGAATTRDLVGRDGVFRPSGPVPELRLPLLVERSELVRLAGLRLCVADE